MQKSFVIILFLGMLIFSAGANSIWQATSASPYTPDKSFKLGDIITINIIESTTAKHSAGTNTDVKDDLGLKLDHTISKLTPILGENNSVNAQWKNKYTGAGKTERLSAVTAKVAASVVDVLDNGNLIIEGKHKLMVNDDEQTISIKGEVRSKDISISNTIDSPQIANAEVSILGKGALNEAEQPGWITRILNWIF